MPELMMGAWSGSSGRSLYLALPIRTAFRVDRPDTADNSLGDRRLAPKQKMALQSLQLPEAGDDIHVVADLR